MDAIALQNQLDDVRVRLLEVLSALPDEALLQPATVGEWSIADVLAHLVNWEAELVTALNRIDQGRRPDRLLRALADREAYNAERYPEIHDRDLDRIFNDLQGVRVQLETWLDEFSTTDLEDAGRYEWAGGRPLWKVIAETTFEHEARHLPALEQAAEKWRRQAGGTIDDGDASRGREDGNLS